MINITNDNFEQEVEQSTIPVVIDFYADWCNPCKAMIPVLEQLATDLEGKFKVVKVNIDQAGDIAKRFTIRGVPTIQLRYKGQDVERKIGTHTLEQLRTWLTTRTLD